MTTTEPRQLALSRQGHYAGPVTRLAAFAVDQAAITGIFTVVVALTRYAIDLITRGRLSAPVSGVLLGIGYALWWLVYFAYPWAVSGKSLGMTLLGIRVVRRDGSDLSLGRACVRALTLPLGFVTLGLGFVGIVVGREHRALHDRLAGSAVAYDWDARPRSSASSQAPPADRPDTRRHRTVAPRRG